MASCPTCRSPLAGDETHCLQCGHRLVPEEAPRPSFGLPALIVGAIALIAVAGVLFALEQVESDAEKTANENVPTVERNNPLGESDQKPTDVQEWPAGTSAYTVALVTTEDEASARTRATAAVGAGVPAGVLDTDAYPTLEPGRWLLFAGRFETQEAAAKEASRYSALGFPEARAEFVSDRRDPEG